jgi:hypothetical protein
VVCIVAHLLLSSKAKGMVEEIEYSALRLENLLIRRGTGEAAAVESGGAS